MSIHDCVIVGAGQAGLSTAFYLQRRGVTPLLLDNQPAPGAAWRHVWPSMTLFSTPDFSNMSGTPMPHYDGYPPAQHVIDYFAAYESRYNFDIRRPIQVSDANFDTQREIFNLEAHSAENSDAPQLNLQAKQLVAATGTWSSPFIPFYPGHFSGRQWHSAFYPGTEPFHDHKVAVVGAANSAAQIAAELTDVAEVTWFTRHEPRWMPDEVDGRELFRRNRMRAHAILRGEPDPGGEQGSGEIVMLPKVLRARDSGALQATPMFNSLDELTADGFEHVIWCTGFRPALGPFRSLLAGAESSSAQLESGVGGFHLVGFGEATGPGSGTILGVQPFAKATAQTIAESLNRG